MNNDESRFITDLPREDLLRMVGIFMGDLFVHYGMWFTESVNRLGVEKALELEKEVLARYFPLAAERLAPYFGVEMEGGIPKALASKSREELLLLLADIAKTWVTSDGLWFQAVEFSSGMEDAKFVNDTCWSHFARMEAFKIRNYLQIGSREGLKALKRSLRFRIYSTINANTAAWDKDGSLLFTMTECRVQSARRRRGLDDYPCKSAGIIEYVEFAKGIDGRIVTECVSCPPDRVPDEAFCTWRFRIAETELPEG